MRVALWGVYGSIELIDRSEPDWKSTASCLNPGAVAATILAEEQDAAAVGVRAMLDESVAEVFSPSMPNDELIEALEGALQSGEIRLTGRRIAVPERLASYSPPAKPTKTEPPPPRVAKEAPASVTPEEATVADAECLEDASNTGSPLITQ